MTQQEYRDLQAINCSMLLALDSHPKYAEAMWKGTSEHKTGKHFDIGSAVDCLITRKADFRKEFVVLDVSIEPKMKEIADRYLEIKESTPFELTEEVMVEKARVDIGYQSKWKPETVFNKFKESATEYLTIAEANKDKTFLSKYEFELCQRLEGRFWSDPNIAKILWNPMDDIDHMIGEVHHYMQEAIVWGSEIKRKALLDLIVYKQDPYSTDSLYHVYPIDIKTYDSTQGSFLKNYYMYQYYYQGAFYSEALYFCNKFSLESTVRKHILHPFLFIVLDKAEILPPLMYELPNSHKMICTEGSNKVDFYLGDIKINNRHITGINNLLNRAEWHIKKDKWEYPYEVYENGTLKIR